MYFLYESFKIEKLKTKGRLALVLDETPYLILSRWRELNPRPLPYQGSALPLSYIGKKRAEDGTQTRDPQLGRLMLYQLSYFRGLRVLTPISCGYY